MTAFILAVIVNNYNTGQVSAAALPLILCLEPWLCAAALACTEPNPGLGN